MKWRLMSAGLLAAAVLTSAVAVVYVQHRTRTLFMELQALEEARDELRVEWGQLQLEQSTWGTHGRVERLARERLDMRLPSRGAAVIVQP